MVDFEELVRTEAYLIWETEGRPHGEDARHWQMALSRVQCRMKQSVERPRMVVAPMTVKRVMLAARKRERAVIGPDHRASA
jgi:hypothetical protein